MKNIALALLTCDRFDYTKRTVESFFKHHTSADFELFCGDDASQDHRVVPFVKDHGFNVIVQNKERKGCTPTTALLVHAVTSQVGGDALIWYIQNDIDFVRALPKAVVDYVFLNGDLGCLRTYGAWKDYIQRANGRYRTQPGRQVQWIKKTILDEEIEFGRINMGLQPVIVRADLFSSVVTDALCENDVNRNWAKFDPLVGRFVTNVTYHFGKMQTPNGMFYPTHQGKGGPSEEKLAQALDCIYALHVTSHGRVLCSNKEASQNYKGRRVPIKVCLKCCPFWRVKEAECLSVPLVHEAKSDAETV